MRVNAASAARTEALQREAERHQATQRALDESQAELARERAAHADTRARLAFRESPTGWLRWPLSVARRLLGGAT